MQEEYRMDLMATTMLGQVSQLVADSLSKAGYISTDWIELGV